MEERNFEVALIFSCSNIFLNTSLFKARQFSENVLRRRHEMKGTVSEDEKTHSQNTEVALFDWVS